MAAPTASTNEEEVCRITGYNRHPSLIEAFRYDAFPFLRELDEINILSVPSATGIEALMYVVELNKKQKKIHVLGLDTDKPAIDAAQQMIFYYSQLSGKIIGDPVSGYEYRGEPLPLSVVAEYFDHAVFDSEKTILTLRDEYRANLSFQVASIVDVQPNSSNLTLCFNFLKYLVDERSKNTLPPLSEVISALYRSSMEMGILMVEPDSGKHKLIQTALNDAGYCRLSECVYVKA